MTISEAFDLALQRHRAGRLAEAEAGYRQILAVQPNHADALHFLGVIAHQAGRNDLAVDLIRRAIVLSANNPCAHSNLGEAYRKMGRLDEAIASYRRALELKSDYPEACNNLGLALRDRGQVEEAIAAYCRALQLQPKYADAQYNLGIALRERGEIDEAIGAYGRALAIKPEFPEALNNLGNALWERGRLDEAVDAFRRALQIGPDDPGVLNNLSHVMRERGQLEEGIAACRRALELKPDFPDAWTNWGSGLRNQGRLDEAVAAQRRAIQLQPDFADAHINLGNALKDIGQIEEAVESYRRALAVKPDNPEARSNLVYTLLFDPGATAGAIDEECERWNRQFSAPVKPMIRPHAKDPAAGRRLRIGYVSPDFRDQVIGRNLAPLLQRHEQREYEIFCYSGVVQADKLTDEFRQRADGWRSTVGVRDEALAEMIRQDGVDILVDLTQHLAGNRLSMFAHRPAPVQASFAGYPESAGVEAIEHRISDRYLEGGAADGQAGRKEHVCLIDSFWCYDPCGAEVEVNGLPAMECGEITFGSLNNFCKVNDPLLRLWARILGTVKDSRLILLSRVGSSRRRALEVFEREGIEGRRVEFVDVQPRREYLETYHRLDVVLDTFPYNGHTTSLDALWMGVPVVSLAGGTPVSRAGLSQLTNLGLPELVAHSEAEYVSIAEGLAGDLPRLANLRSNLRERMKKSVLMDAPRFTRQVEQAYREMWRAWLLGGG